MECSPLAHGVCWRAVRQAELGSSHGVFGPLGAMLGIMLADREGWLAMTAIIAAHVGLFLQWRAHARVQPR